MEIVGDYAEYDKMRQLFEIKQLHKLLKTNNNLYMFIDLIEDNDLQKYLNKKQKDDK